MKKRKNEEGSKSLHLGIYFGLLVAFIILVSITFKIIATVKNSKFDGDNFFTVAVISDRNAQLISVSPKDSSLKKLVVTGVANGDDLKQNGIPVDSFATAKSGFNASPKSYFTKVLLHREGIKSNLTIIDLIRLSLFAQKIENTKITDAQVSLKDKNEVAKIASEWFIDPELAKENVSIEITNASEVGGLGSKVAKELTNMGGSVLLVNSSKDPKEKSKIYYKEDSYTVKKISKLLGISAEKKDANSISDIVIEIGKDKGDL